MQYCIFEDDHYVNLQPLVYFRPVYDLMCGMTSLLAAFEKYLPTKNMVLHMRPQLKDLFYPQYSKDLLKQKTIFVNGTILADRKLKQVIHKLLKTVENDTCFCDGDRVVFAIVSEANMSKIKMTDTLSVKSFYSLDVIELAQEIKESITFINYYWDLVKHNETALIRDFKGERRLFRKKSWLPLQSAKLSVKKRRIYLGKRVKVAKNVVFDASHGPILIDDGSYLMSGSVIMGPAYIGKNSTIKAGAKIYHGTSIGSNCKIGGEVENSIISDFSNKQHDGFLGHAYLGQWINLGAGTENSDLKNNYSVVEVEIGKKKVNSGELFVGCAIGDHTKTGIKTMINTGSVFGPFCNIYGSGYQKKNVAPFSWGNSNEKLVANKIARALETATLVMKRRNVPLNDGLKNLYKTVFKETAKERK